jgi:hypothetical protein
VLDLSKLRLPTTEGLEYWGWGWAGDLGGCSSGAEAARPAV